MNRRIKKITAIVLVLMLLMFSVGLFFGTKTANAETIEQYESQIEENNNKINNLEEIKNQLHILAELLRSNDYVNNDLDSALSQKWHECHETQSGIRENNTELESKIKTLKSKRFVGNFKITHYCPCRTCNGSWGSKTALGTTMTPYKTIAVDPKVIPLGSKVEINGQVYIAEDTGGAIRGYRIDMCVSSHSEANQKGVLHNVPVYIINE